MGFHLSRLRHLGWNQCSHGLTSRPLESCHHQCLKAVCGVLDCPKSSDLEFVDGTLKLRHCTTLFSMRFHPGLYLVLVMVVVNGGIFFLVILSMQVVMWVKGSSLPGRHVQVYLHTVIQIQGIQRRGDGKDCALLPPKEWGVRWACLAIFFLDLGLGEVCTGDAWNLPSEGTGLRGFPAGQSSRRDQCTVWSASMGF